MSTRRLAKAPKPAAVAAVPDETLSLLVSSDGTWMRCLYCEGAYWGVFRGDEYVMAKALKHFEKAHASA